MKLVDSLVRTSLAGVLLGGLATSAFGAPGRVQTLTARPGLSSARPAVCGHATTEAINSSGGVFTFPRCGGTMAKITYGPNNAPASATFTFTSSTTNPQPSVCSYVADTVFFPIEYVLAHGNGSANVTFQATSRSSRIRVRHPNQNTYYTFWAFVNGNEQFNENLGTPNSQGRFTFPSPLNDQTLPLGLPICFEFGEGP